MKNNDALMKASEDVVKLQNEVERLNNIINNTKVLFLRLCHWD